MLPLSAYHEATRLDEPFPTPADDLRSNLDPLRVALGGLKNRCHPGVDPNLSVFPQKELVFVLHHELTLRDSEPIDDEIIDAINLLLYRHSAYMGHMAVENLMRISDVTPASNYSPTHNVAVWRGDARELAAGAVINAAIPNLLGYKDPLYPHTDNYIQGQDGPWVHDDCSIVRKIQGRDQEVDDTVLTRGYRLPAQYVLHTLGPRLNGDEITDKDREKLVAYYTSYLGLILEKSDIHNVSFCALSTNRNNFPFEEATHIVFDAVNQWFQYHGASVTEPVVFNIFEGADAEGYIQALESWVED